MSSMEELFNLPTNNKKKLSEEINKINDSMYVKSILYLKRGDKFYDIYFVNNGIENFIGRFTQIEEKIEVLHNKDKLLICKRQYIEKGMKIIKVLGMYNILDNMLYYCTELEALNLFDSSIDKKYLKSPKNTLYRLDIEKKRRNEESTKKI